MRYDRSKLTLLRCSNCGSDLSGLSTDVIFYCSECGRCWISGERLSPVSIEFLRIGGSDSIFLPFWKVDASVNILNRVSRKRSSSLVTGVSREFTGRERGLTESDSGSRQVRFIFPAFSTNLVLSTGVRMHRENFLPEKVEDGKRFMVIGGSVGMDDAALLTRAVAVGVEVNRTDYLASVDLEIEVHSAGIYAIGCTPGKNVFRINGSEIGILFAAVNDSDEILKKNHDFSG
ncbi:MAG: hypothetical protein KAT09_02505 [Candidatus Aegiribacteria sp.]|nr:hypothetical protein [Candidatus Aegiribacteria sp.]